MDLARGVLITHLLVLLPALALASGDAATSGMKRVRGVHISIALPAQHYTSIVEQDSTSTITASKKAPTIVDFALVKQRAVGGTPSGSGSVCLGPLSECVKAGGALYYWIDGATNKIQVGDPTEPVSERKIGAWQAFESFPLCGWATAAGVSSPYDGQCYAVVLASTGKTVSFQLLLGQNSGCKNMERCWKKQLADMRNMLASVE